MRSIMARGTTSNAGWVQPEQHDGRKSPVLSIIVPVYNSVHELERCLTALQESRGTKFEVLVVDDGSTQPLESLVHRFGYRYMRIEGPGGPARARNRGAMEVNGTHLVFIDADVCVHPDTLLRMADAFVSNPSVDAVVGTYDDTPAEPGFLSQYKNLFHHFVHQANSGPISTFWSGCGALRREVFLKFGGFDEKRYRRPAIEDIELGTWMTAAGHRILLDRRIRCKHLKRWTMRSLLKTDILDRGIPWMRLMLRAKHMPATLNTSPAQLASVALVYMTLVALLGTIWSSYAWLPAIIGLGAVTILNRNFYQYFFSRRGWWFTLRSAPMHWLYFCYCGFCVAAGTLLHLLIDKTNAGEKTAGVSDRKIARQNLTSLLTIGLMALTLFLYGRGVSTSSGYAGDAPHHLMNSIFMHDALEDFGAAVTQPRNFAYKFYRHYPALNLGYYPPVFSGISGALMFITGVSAMSAQMAVLLMALLLACFSFAWFRLHLEPLWAAAATAVLMSTPMLVYWGTDIMLEIPVLAWMMGAMWAFERILRSPNPAWRDCLLWALLTSLAVWTKQHALLLLGIFAISALASGRWRHLKRAPVSVSAGCIALAAAGLIGVTLYIGGDAVNHSVGTRTQSRFTAEQWTFYLRGLPEIVGWPTLVLAGIGAFILCIRRHPFISPALGWIVLFYMMHSYFVARNVRYGCLWIPPFCLLAAFALKNLLPSLSLRRGAITLGGTAMAIFTAVCVIRGAQAHSPIVPNAYQKAAEEIIQTMPPFSCLTFFPDRPGRMATCYRLAVEARKTNQQDLYSFGKILRADQILNSWETDAAAMAQMLKKWNVLYLVVETPRPLNRQEMKTNLAIENLLSLGQLQEYRRYPVSYEGTAVPERTLIVYEWNTRIPFAPLSEPTIKTRRIPTIIPASRVAQ